jgi:hypothetical protein
LTYFRMDSMKQPELTRACQLNEAVLRNLVLRVDDRLVDALVQHATTAHVVPPSDSKSMSSRPRRGDGDDLEPPADLND